MQLPHDSQKKMMAAYNLLSGKSVSFAAFEEVRQLAKGIHPGLDKKLEIASIAFTKVQKLQTGDVISLSVEHLPEDTEEKKKRKKAILFFINTVKDIQSEIKRVEGEFSNNHAGQNFASGNVKTWGRIIGKAKGPFGLATLAAVGIIVIASIVGMKSVSQKNVSQSTQQVSPSGDTNSIQVILFNGKQIPLSQLRVGHPHSPNCDDYHYHAISANETVTTLDNQILIDPGNCGFGKVSQTKVQTVSIPQSK